ncbi:ground-like domain protein, partial [Cooperia oncophora]
LNISASPGQCTSSLRDTPHTLSNGFCCDPKIPFLVDNQLSTNNGMGAITRAVQERVQSQFNTTFEVIISESDFVVNTYYTGLRQCKFETDRYYVALYETPEQYDLNDVATESRLASVDSRDPLGWKESPLAAEKPGQN